MCKKPVHIKVKNTHINNAFPESFIELDAPCGKCIQCLRRRQIDYSTRLYRECKDAESMYFVTLTYNNAHLPISQSIWRKLPDGIEEKITVPKIVDDSDLLYTIRGKLANIPSTNKARYVVNSMFLDIDNNPLVIDGVSYMVKYTPSLCREDVKNWLKGCRVQWKRDTDENLDFRYAWCGEYGPNGCRPHYHMVFLGISAKQLEFCLSRWRSRGYTYHTFVPRFNKDGSDARFFASRYIGKYVSKGKFDCDSVLDGTSFKGRLCNSKRFGTFPFTDDEIAYYRAYDLYGAYDIDTMCLYEGGYYFDKIKPSLPLKLSQQQRDRIVAEVFKRSFYQIICGDKCYKNPLPRAFRRYLFYVVDYVYDKKLSYNEKTCSFKKIYRASLLSRLVMDYLSNRAAFDNKQKFAEFCSLFGFSETDINSVIKYEKYLDDITEYQPDWLDEDNFAFEIVQASKDGQ